MTHLCGPGWALADEKSLCASLPTSWCSLKCSPSTAICWTADGPMAFLRAPTGLGNIPPLRAVHSDLPKKFLVTPAGRAGGKDYKTHEYITPATDFCRCSEGGKRPAGRTLCGAPGTSVA